MMKKGSGKSTNTLNLKGKGLAVKQLKGSLVLLGMGNFLTLPDPEVSIPGGYEQQLELLGRPIEQAQ